MEGRGRLCANGSDGHHLSGQVTDVAFRGRGYEHAIDISGDTRLTGVFADVRAARARPSGCAWTGPAVTSSRRISKTIKPMGPNGPGSCPAAAWPGP
ncbi:MAG: hypothetical protein ACRDOE_23445, partial [Streptosporangiaceae bacterium]